ncbi:hypothetical protein Ahu01nite_090240 [Winogradskya humida]|uniref:Uncharacterized protein n=1 Tax=Winogradskya humida TaxID=113566 RepID=A0ABQ4A4Z3_9ACTN|nr:hypothetical protein Ahu01nite_090240 [Actinoplanes humidus]
MKYLTIAYALGKQALSSGKRHTVGAPEHPAAVFFAVVGEPLARVAQDFGEQFGQWHVLRQRDVDPARRRADRDSSKTYAHGPISHR